MNERTGNSGRRAAQDPKTRFGSGKLASFYATIKVYDVCDEFDELDDFITLRQEDFAILRAMALEYGEPDVEEFLYRVAS